ncbi:nitrogen fixation protein NifS [Mixta intestinalis]|uniref:nitrogen fixation protein NifS n=1 Tax=Mixta intestinalis TaxID=1615494 RepID=UPI001367C4FA|nr:nitrogen fixation protein NifS [Mixta intestinalis]
MSKKIVFVFNSSPVPGRSPPISSAIFSWFCEENYIQALDSYLKREGYPWVVEQDTSEADIEILKNYAEIIICAPGLRWQFYTNGFDKKNIIYLSTMEYATNNIERVCRLIKSTEMEGR